MPQIMLVDDDPDNLEVLGFILEQKYRVLSFGSAHEALAALDQNHVDLLVLDISMAPLDGVHCLDAIRARPGYAGVPAIALTAHARPVDRQAFLAAGFQVVVTKPVLDQRALLETIERLVAGTQAPASGRSVGACEWSTVTEHP